MERVAEKGNIGGANGERLMKPGGMWAEALHKIYRNKAAVAGFFIFALICLACAFAPVLTKWKYDELNTNSALERPSLTHIFGTDRLGRDMLSRVLYGGRFTLRIALISTALAALVGGATGLLAGYFVGRADFIISHCLDMLAAIPIFLLIVAAEFALGWGKGNFMYAMAIAALPQFARLVRASVMEIMGSEYIEAARALGMSHAKIILKHVLHNVAPPLIIRFTSGLSEALLICTIMGYLSIGVNPPNPEWGALAYFSKGFLRSHPHLMVIPCAAITISVISLNLFGDGLRDALDPRN